MNRNSVRTRLALGLSLLLLGSAAQARAQEVSLNEGDRAPSFVGKADNGKLWRSSDVVGKKLLVVYFYPAAMSGGCTKQACMFRDNRTKLKQLGAEVVGVSGDRVGNLKAFKGANRLNFPLLADSTGTIARAFGVPVSKGGVFTAKVKGKKGEEQQLQLTRDVTAARWTFVIDRTGKVVFKETKVNPEGDSQAVIEAITKMNTGL